MRTFNLIVTLFLLTLTAAAQDDECMTVSDKKVKKLLEQANNPKTTPTDRHQLLKDALAIDPECAPCLYQLGKRAFDKAYKDGTSYHYAEDYFKKLINACPKYHSDPYYYMGVIAYSKEDYETAITWFKQFTEFKITDDSQMAEDHPEKKKDAKAILPECEFYASFFKNLVAFSPQPVENVCTVGDEYLPMISPDNEFLFFTRRIDRRAMGDMTSRMAEEFSMSQRNDINSPFDAGIKLPAPFNIIGDNYGGATISVDNKELIVCACRKDNKRKPDYNNCDLYGTKYERVTNPTTGKLEYKWGELVNLGPNINTPEGWEAQPSLSADGRTLYFAVVRETPGQDPNMDIYYSTRDDKGNWTPAKPLAAINTSGNEKTPFMHSDSKTLYFSAEVGEKYWGAGGYDIFFTRQKADGSWTTPQNIGYPINSTEDEPGMIVSTDGKLAYYSSSKLKGSKGYDIYRFELPEFARPEKVIIVKGQVTDENGDPLANAKIEISYTGDNKKEIVKVDPTDGKYAAVVNVQNGNDAVVTVKAEDRTFDSKLIAANSSTVVKAADLKAEKLEIGKAYTIKDILFASNSFELSAASKFVIDQFIVFLKENPNIKIAIHGHTDDRGVPAENLKLSDNRAKAVMDYIVSKGVAANRLSAQGFGQNKPKAPNTSEENRRQNRRTEFVIVAK
ncbi:MAG TPA: hypothetical protein DEP18_03345 [Flavobacteriales bacterium]|nr:hypothetical protein [Flavobacteriales bacterium]HRE75387.1 OmpA family protein [Flavobacteriales bacterium]HRE96078.1 OmpA family protein [Flavobacteriales bacterium]HRJ37452.1 OmpA family protein [Flavobacteriales bacterium]